MDNIINNVFNDFAVVWLSSLSARFPPPHSRGTCYDSPCSQLSLFSNKPCPFPAFVHAPSYELLFRVPTHQHRRP